jgi:flagellar hook-associated protein 2
MLDKLVDKENQYYAKFTAMETALSKMNSQISWLTQQTG